MIADSGTSTSRLNHSIAMPRPEPGGGGQGVARGRTTSAARPAPLSGGRPAYVDRRPGEGAGTLLLALLAEVLLERGDDAEGVALLAVTEELVGGLAPAAEVVVERVERLRGRERVARVVGALDLGDRRRRRRPAGSRTARSRPAPRGWSGTPGTPWRPSPASVGDGGRVLDEQGVRRDDVVDVRTVLLGEDRLVLVGEQHVAAAVGERGGRLAAAGRERDGVVQQLGQVRLARGLVVGAAGGVRPGRRGCSSAPSRTSPGSA